MKKLFIFFSVIFITIASWAQSPQKMSYQAVIRDGSNNLIVSHSVGIRVSILQGITPIYVETHSTNTNANGLVTIEIGSGTFVSGISFTAIDWSTGIYSIKTETDPTGGANYSAIIGTSQLLSVPYALYAEKSGTSGLTGPTGDQGIQGITGTTGATGDQGLQGIQGPTGTTGDQGLQGIQGPTGADGALNAWSILGNTSTNAGTNFIGTTDANDFVIKTNNTEKMRVSSSGKIGIGVTNGTYPLEVRVPSTLGSQMNLKLTNLTLGTGSGVGILFAPDDAAIAKMGIFVERRGSWGVSTMHFLSRTSSDYASADLSNSVMAITQNGNVGIGTTSPTSKLEVNGIIKATGGNSTNWNTAYNWGNHASVGYLTSEVDGSTTNELQALSISNDTIFLSNGGFVKLPAGFDGQYSSLIGTPSLFDGTWTSLSGKPLLWDSTWVSIKNKPILFDGNYSSLSNLPTLYDGQYSSLTGTPTNIDEDKTDDVNLTGNQTIAGNKTFSGTISASNQTITNVASPIANQDAANKAYVDLLKQQIKNLEDMLIANGTFRLYDIEGNSYKVVKIGTQVWMAENLKTTKFNDSTSIPLVTDNTAWYNLATPAYCWYNNDEATYKSTYGAMYNWNTVNTGILCPIGWHVPSSTEWTTMVTYLGGVSVAGGKLKESGTTHWCSPNTGVTNETGFTALPGGYRDAWGLFSYNGTYGQWWSSSEEATYTAYFRGMNCNNNGANSNGGYKKNGISVRCVRD